MEFEKQCIERIAAAVFLTSLVSCGLLAMLTSADAEPVLEDHDSEKEDYDFESGGLYFNIHDDDTVYVQGIDVNQTGHLVDVPCFVSDPEDGNTVYKVTGLESDAFKRGLGIQLVRLPITLGTIGTDAFRGLFTNNPSANVCLPQFYDGQTDRVTIPGLFVDDDPEKGNLTKGLHDEYMEDYDDYADRLRFIKDEYIMTVEYHIGIDDQAELKATNIGDFEDGYYTQTVYEWCSCYIIPCQYERDYFECVSWVSDSGKVYGLNDSIYAGNTPLESVLYAQWEENGYDYPAWSFTATNIVIVILALVGCVLWIRQRLKSRQV